MSQSELTLATHTLGAIYQVNTLSPFFFLSSHSSFIITRPSMPVNCGGRQFCDLFTISFSLAHLSETFLVNVSFGVFVSHHGCMQIAYCLLRVDCVLRTSPFQVSSLTQNCKGNTRTQCNLDAKSINRIDRPNRKELGARTNQDRNLKMIKLNQLGASQVF